MPDNNKKTNNTGSFIAFVFLVLFAIIIANYSYDESVNDGLKYYWNYAFMSLILEGVIVGSLLLSCCCIICAAMKENETCVTIISYATPTIICLCAIANIVFMYILVHNNPEVAKFKLIDSTGTYPVMLQVVCIIQCFAILLLTAIAVIGVVGSACFHTVEKCNSLNDPLTPVVQSPDNNV